MRGVHSNSGTSHRTGNHNVVRLNHHTSSDLNEQTLRLPTHVNGFDERPKRHLIATSVELHVPSRGFSNRTATRLPADASAQ